MRFISLPARARIVFVEHWGPGGVQEILLSSHVSCLRLTETWLSSLLPSPVTRQNISFRQYLGGGGCGRVCGCQVNNWICRRVKKRERCSNPSPANQVARMQISTNQTPVKSSTLLSEACRSLRNKQIYPWERGGIVLCSVIIQEEF